MTDQSQPEWLKNFVPQPMPSAGKWQKGQSGNPQGRPPGRPDARTKITRALAEDGAEIVRVVLDAALEGDMQACSIILARIAPTLRPQSERVAFDLDHTASATKQVEQVLAAVASGSLAPDVAKQIVDTIAALSSVRRDEELEARLAALEEKQL